MDYPNKTFVFDIERRSGFGDGKMKTVIVLAAKNKEVGAKYLTELKGITIVPNQLVWLMDTNHKTMYDQKGEKPLKVQAKVLYSTSVIVD